MKKILSIALVLMMVLGVLTVAVSADATTVWDGSTDATFAGAGTASNPYQITSAEELAGLSLNVNSGNAYAGKYFKLMNDIVLNEGDATTWGETAPANNFTAIGTWTAPFGGIFDGDGHTVSGLYISIDADGQGLFGVVQGGSVVKNFAIVNSYIEAKGGGCTAAFVGQTNRTKSGDFTFEGLYTDATIIATGNEVGGIVGNISNTQGDFTCGTVYIKGCVFAGSITVNGSKNLCGGMVGNGRAETIEISNCAFYGSISIGGKNAAGIYAGETGYYTITNCISAGEVSAASNACAIATNSKTKASADGERTVTGSYYLEGSAAAGATKNSDGNEGITSFATISEVLGAEAAITLEGFTKRENDTMLPTAVVSFAPSTTTKYFAEFTVTWKNHDGTVLATETYLYGAMPEYKGEAPTKAEDDTYLYHFNCWTPVIVAVNGDTTYTAEFYRERKDIVADEETETEAIETNNAPVTDTSTETDAAEEEGGCASVVGGGAAAMIAIIGACALSFRKKED